MNANPFPPRVALIGFMGTGKTTVGQELARLRQTSFLDLDAFLLQQSNATSIQQIFQQEGEDGFRAHESRSLAQLPKPLPNVLATGGGLVERVANVQQLQQMGYHIVWLQATFPTIQQRLQNDTTRPLFQHQQHAEQRYQQRQFFYRGAAQTTLQTDQLSPRTIATRLQQQLQALHSPPHPPKLFALWGDPVSHSLSPQMHNAAYHALGLPFRYLAMQVAPHQLSTALQGAEAMGFQGLACTLPHKETILPLLDQITPLAQEIGAVNTVVRQNNQWLGSNTDWLGILRPLQQRRPLLSNARVAILGAGGTARAAAVGLRQENAHISFFNRTLSKANAIAHEFGGTAYSLDDLQKLEEFEIIIHTTSVGMHPHIRHSLVPPTCFHPHHLVFDAVYRPRTTQLLNHAQARGAETIEGLEMFLHQGFVQFQRHTGHEAPQDVMQRSIELALSSSFPTKTPASSSFPSSPKHDTSAPTPSPHSIPFSPESSR